MEKIESRLNKSRIMINDSKELTGIRLISEVVNKVNEVVELVNNEIPKIGDFENRVESVNTTFDSETNKILSRMLEIENYNVVEFAEQLTQKMKKGDIVANVKDFGAKGDGVTDDLQSIQDAMSSIVSGVLFFPIGTYLLSGTLNIKSNITLRGMEESTTIIKPTNDFRLSMQTIGNNLIQNSELANSNALNYNGNRNIVIENLTFIHQDTKPVAPLETNGSNCIALDNCANIVIRNCTFRNWGQHSIDISGCYNVLIERTTSVNGYWSAIQVDMRGGTFNSVSTTVSKSEYVIIRNNIVSGCTTNRGAIHIHKTGGDYITIENNRLTDNLVGITTDDYINDNFSMGKSTGLIIQGNTIISNTVGAIGIAILKDYDSVNIENNIIILSASNANALLVIAGGTTYRCTDITIKNNNFKGNVEIWSIYEGKINDNTFNSNSKRVEVTCLNSYIKNNIFKGFGLTVKSKTKTDVYNIQKTIVPEFMFTENNRFVSKNVSDLIEHAINVDVQAYNIMIFRNNMGFTIGRDVDVSACKIFANNTFIIENELLKRTREINTTTYPTTNLIRGQQSFNSANGRPIWWNGSVWIYADGALV